jgi:signal transduction histidine kinase
MFDQSSMLQAALESGDAIVFSVDRQYRYTCFNSRHAAVMKALYGVGIELGKSLLEYQQVTDDHVKSKANLDRALNGESFTDEAYSGIDCRSRLCFGVLHSPISTPSGEIIGVLVLANEITERRRVEEAWRQSETRYRSLFENMLEGFAYCRMLFEHDQPLDFVYLEVNGAFEQLTGLSNVVGRKVTDVIPGIRESDPELFEIYGRVVKTGRPERIEIYLNSLGIWFAMSVYCPEEEHFAAVFHSLTGRKRAEAELSQRAAELARSNADLEQFAYIASHDLQEPLRMVSSYTQLLARRYKGKLGADADDFIAFAVDGANRMQALINDLLAYSRLGTRGKPFAATSCETVLAHVLNNMTIAIQESGCVVTHDPLPTVRADEVQIKQLLQNLIGNAIKFRGQEPPHIQVSAKLQSAGRVGTRPVWLFFVRDNGIGVDPQHFERIFIIFQRLHGAGEYPGSGMGLAICKKIVERHGGRIWVESAAGHGSTFYFTLPA